jgi:Fe-S-cluster-containing hydrogenase component 2
MEATKSESVVYDPNACSACGVCEVMCSLFHEGRIGPSFVRCNILRDAFTAEHKLITCLQCNDPPCYDACPSKDKALCIDAAAGVAYINENECDGCGLCVEACPFDPPRIRIHLSKRFAIKCDLCRSRKEGPICVEYCPFQALTFCKTYRRESV